VAAWYASLGETLWWIAVLDEQYWNRNPSVYEELRENDEDGYVIAGLRLARNRVGHQLALLLVNPDGSPVSSSQPAGLSLDTPVWRQLKNLPPVKKHYADKEKKQRPVYEARLAGNPPRFALAHARRFFIRRGAALDSAIFSP